jgi:hypothetical protein
MEELSNPKEWIELLREAGCDCRNTFPAWRYKKGPVCAMCGVSVTSEQRQMAYAVMLSLDIDLASVRSNNLMVYYTMCMTDAEFKGFVERSKKEA